LAEVSYFASTRFFRVVSGLVGVSVSIAFRDGEVGLYRKLHRTDHKSYVMMIVMMMTRRK
jgi:hypothetical protein